MARLTKREAVGTVTVVELGVEGGMYLSANGLISHNCKTCERLHLLGDGVTPRVWLSSEVRGDKWDSKSSHPFWQDHPNGRCALISVLPGFGFNAAGKITWIGVNHDEWAHQRDKESRFKKSEVYEKLLKSTRAGEEIFHKLLPRYEDNGKRYKFRAKPSEEWATGPSYNSRPEHALYWALKDSKFLAYYRKMSPKKRGEFNEKLNHYGPTRGTSWYYGPPYFEDSVEKLRSYLHPNHRDSPGEDASSPPLESEEEVKALLNKLGLSQDYLQSFREMDNPSKPTVPGKHRAEIDALLDKHVPGWREHKPREFDTPHPRLVDAVANGDLSINVPSESLRGIMREGRWRNLFETGDGMGNTDPGIRAHHERERLGISSDLVGDDDDEEVLSGEKRPVYGWLNFGKHLFGANYGEHGVRQYGDVVVKLKPHVKKRATLTVGDSFGVDPKHVFLADKHSKQVATRLLERGGQGPAWNAVARGETHQLAEGGGKPAPDAGHLEYKDPDYGGYVEAQIHGGVYPDTDVASIHYDPNHDGRSRAVAFGKHFKVPVYKGATHLIWHPSMEEPKMEKSLKGAVAGLTFGLASVVAPSSTANSPMEQPGPVYTVQPPAKPPAPPLHPHLKAISFLESSGGQNTKHRSDPRGDWWTAHGHLGFKPAVAHEFYRKHAGLQQHFPGLKDPKDFLLNFKSDPVLYDSIANEYWKDLLAKTKAPGLAAFKWRNGRYAKQIGWKDHEYVRRFTDLYQPISDAVRKNEGGILLSARLTPTEE